MKTVRILLVSLVLSAAFATTLFAQQSPAPATVGFVTPNFGPVTGGTIVTVSGSKFDLPPGFACIAPCPPRVFFGDAEATVREAGSFEIVVVTPPHEGPSALVDVTVRTGDGRTATRGNAFTYTSEAPAGYELWLLPTYLDVPLNGAGGSRWETDLWLRNNNTTEVAQLTPWPCPNDAANCVSELAPGEALHNLTPFFRLPNASIARLLYVSRNAAAKVSANLRIADASRNDLDAGTEVPVVREEDLKTGFTTLHNVPFSPSSRALLRIYDVSELGTDFIVRVYPENANKDPQNAIATFFLHSTQPEAGEFRSTPGVVEFDLASRVSPNAGPVRVTVQTGNEGRRFWPMVSVTNNTTNHVTLVTPQ
jgi:hypothetical protein